MAKTVRLDQELVDRGIAGTRSYAKALVMAGDVLINGVAASRPAANVQPTDEITLKARPRFVSRGGEKLAHALDVFSIDVTGMVAADFGASTGGFTDCLLQNGAIRSYAIDVGYGVLDQRIRDDERVIVMERLNVRYLESLAEPIDIVVIDVSFIGLEKIYPAVKQVLKPGGICIPLVKPQFEAGKSDVGKGGVVKDAKVHRRVLNEAAAFAGKAGFSLLGLTASSLVGPAGNVEFLAHLVLGEVQSPELEPMIDMAMEEAAERVAIVKVDPAE
jgi:23S rRNA (cytidine1920-2'-O)/16S rRNA (cytidine1409-2'-O)-methyltransferase